MDMPVYELLEETAEFALDVAVLYFVLSTFAKWRRNRLHRSIERHRLLIIVLLTLGVTAMKVGDEVLEGETGPVDEALMMYIRESVPGSMEGFFRAVTFTGAGSFLTPLTIVLSLALLMMGKRFEALLLGISGALGALIIYLIKTLVGRARPALWETDWYWGSSFPSGHTLQVAATATAGVIIAARLLPGAVPFLVPCAVSWIVLAGMSRLVLGVHWPSDVLTAACLGIIIPFVVQFILPRGSDPAAPDGASGGSS